MNVRSGDDIVGIEEHEVDVVVVGSGGGGGPAALELGLAGLDVLVLEAGPLVRPEQLTQRSLDTARRFYVDRGAQETVDGNVLVLQGSCVGGSTVLNGEVCFRIPDAVLEEWARDFGVRGLDAATLAPVFEEVERRIHATTDGGRNLGGATHVLPGFAKLGLEAKPVLRNVEGCRGCQYCFFGCAWGCKQSVDRSYLPGAIDAGVRVISDARVERLDMVGARAAGVTARTKHGTLRVRAKAVVLACGAIATPLMLLDHGLGGADVGRHLALHPICAPLGLFDDDAEVGTAMIGAYTDAYLSEGFLLETFSLPLDYLATVLPGIGAEHQVLAREARRYSGIAIIARDTGSLGRVTRGRSGKKEIHWALDGATDGKIRRGIRRVAEIHFAAGAHKVLLPSFEVVEVRSASELDAVDRLKLGPGYLTFGSYHPQGTARLGAVTDMDARVTGTDNLYVMDTSLFPSPAGVNTQVAVMAVATVMARRLATHMA
ncbi:MAG: GMC family oxidoreductase [Sandaracinaceae bacterium]|nr:GMC family oxidoreductase [Sandaracinaceae bacterium]